MKRSIFVTYVFIALTGWLTACSDEMNTPGTDSGEETPFSDVLNITVKVPSAQTVSTYSMSPLEECEITTIDVLVFDNTNTANKHQFLYHEAGVDIQEVSGNDTQRTFSMKIRQTSDPNNVYLMVLANVADTVEQLIEEGEIVEGDSREEVIKKLLFKLPYDETTAREGGKWLVKPGRYTRFPMWGVSDPIDLTQPTILVSAVSLLRAAAKIDIGLNFDASDNAQGLGNDFFLEEFYLYNAYSSLMIAPFTANYDETGKKVTDVSLPDGATTFTPNDPIAYARRAYRGDAGYYDFLNEIYLAEHPEGSQEDRENNVAIVIGGRYGSKTAAITYYRIDLVKHDNGVSSTEWLPVLRNHRYRINITKVLNRGYDSKEEAFAAMGLNTNLEVDIEDKDENVTENVYDGQYRLGVDKTTFTVDKDGISSLSAPKQIYVNTNLEAGWKATASVTWIKFIQDDGTTTGTSKSGPTGVSYLKFLVDANTGSQRTGKITIQAGRLFMEINITQTARADISFANVYSVYPMDAGGKYFTIISSFDWAIRIPDDTYNIISSFTPRSGVANQSGDLITFTCLDEILMRALPADKRDQYIEFEVYSPKEEEEFEPKRVSIHLSTDMYDIGNLYVFPVDQPTGYTWYLYANVPDNTNNNTVPGPGASGQVSPPRLHSCASLGTNWRLPTQAEANTLKNTITTSNYGSYGFSNAYYWLATSYSTTNAYRWIMSNGITTSNIAKTYTGNRARCVRGK
ncbi:MAG: hypothetical protein LUG98_03610 [Tannerellaceae bacterium]|nr:hypothetical protein [Tannerellaceae bacterium]